MQILLRLSANRGEKPGSRSVALEPEAHIGQAGVAGGFRAQHSRSQVLGGRPGPEVWLAAAR